MSAPAGNLRDNLEFQLMTRPLLYADQILDTNHDGLLSIGEVEAIMGTPGENLAPLQAAGLVEKNNTTDQYQWHSVITSEQRGNINIEGELKPLIVMQVQLLLSNETMQASPRATQACVVPRREQEAAVAGAACPYRAGRGPHSRGLGCGQNGQYK